MLLGDVLGVYTGNFYAGDNTLPFWTRSGGLIILTSNISAVGDVVYNTVPYYISFSYSLGYNTIKRTSAGGPVIINAPTAGGYIFLRIANP